MANAGVNAVFDLGQTQQQNPKAKLTNKKVMMIQCVFVISRPLGNHQDAGRDVRQDKMLVSHNESNLDNNSTLNNEKVISVRITSSVAIGRTKVKQPKVHNNSEFVSRAPSIESTTTESLTSATEIININEKIDLSTSITTIPPELIGANIEFIKQLDAKKKSREQIHTYELVNKYNHFNENEEILEESSSTILDEHDEIDDIEEIPHARKISSSSFVNELNNKKDSDYITDYDQSLKTEEKTSNIKNISSEDIPSDTLISNISYTNNVNLRNTSHTVLEFNNNKKLDTLDHEKQFHDNARNDSNQTEDSLAEPSFRSATKIAARPREKGSDDFNLQISAAAVSQQNYYQDFNNKKSNGRSQPRLTTVSFNVVHDIPQIPKIDTQPTSYMNPTQIYREQQLHYQPPKIYSEPARIYSEPAKFYSEPAKIYSEPAKIYSEPAKIYSEPAKIYSVPAKFYSEPASLHLGPNLSPKLPTWQQQSNPPLNTTAINTTPTTTIEDLPVTTDFQKTEYPQAEENYEVDENVSVLTNGRSHGVQTTTEKCKDDNCKVGYVVEGRQFKKYRVEERTSDGFIVGEYGVVRNEDGALRGVRYTADSDASPRLIYDALMKFLQLR